jgi:hypothetical protein
MGGGADHFDMLQESAQASRYAMAVNHFLKPYDFLSGDYGSDPLTLVIHYHQRPVAILQYWNSKIFVEQVGLGYEL